MQRSILEFYKGYWKLVEEDERGDDFVHPFSEDERGDYFAHPFSEEAFSLDIM